MSSDPVADFEQYDADQERKLHQLPKCFLCGEHIQQEEAFHLKTLSIDIWICDECITNNMEETLEDA